MSKYNFSAYALTKEFDLNSIAQHFNIHKEFKWEDNLILKKQHLIGIMELSELKSVYIYSFGSIVFINFSQTEMTTFMKFLEINFNILENPFALKFIDEYELDIIEGSEPSIANNHAICPTESKEFIDIISLVLARSVALDNIENSINKVIDEVEDIIVFLEKGKLNIKDASLAKLASKILGFKYTSISYIMIFDKPAITWEDIEVDNFYYELSDLFELQERYVQIRDKVEILMDITEVFSTLSHECRSTRLEWIIIILIAVEFATALIELFFRIINS